MARAALDWSIKTLADKANVGPATVSRFERQEAEPIPATLSAIRTALEVAGAIFIAENGDGPGVRLRKDGEAGTAP